MSGDEPTGRSAASDPVVAAGADAADTTHQTVDAFAVLANVGVARR